VHKERKTGRVVSIALAVVLGTWQAVAAVLKRSGASRTVNTSFVERHQGADRHRNARKSRKTYRFSKAWRVHEAVTSLTLYAYNFCCPVRTLAVKDDRGRRQPPSPAIAAGLADHVWSMTECITVPAVRHR
jgi:hypothetical protein